MARARNIKPGFFKNEDLAECSPWARLCFAGLWTLADREGRLEDRPKRIKGELFAFDSVEVEPLLAELAKHRFILRYEAADGRGLIQVEAFTKHQNPHHREPPSDLPPPQSPGLKADATTQKPEASAASQDSKAQGQPGASLGQGTPSCDLARGSSRAESGALIPEHPIRSQESANALSARGAVGIALKAGGIDPLGFNTADPRVDALIAAGATPQQWEGLAREAVTTGKGKPFAWVLAVLPERLKTAGGIKANGKHAGFASKDYRAGDGSDGLIPG